MFIPDYYFIFWILNLSSFRDKNTHTPLKNIYQLTLNVLLLLLLLLLPSSSLACDYIPVNLGLPWWWSLRH